MGYDIDQFVSRVDDGLICDICKRVLEDPVMVIKISNIAFICFLMIELYFKTVCQHIFCGKCIKDSLIISDKCPVDKKIITHLSKVPPAVTSILNR